MTWSAVRVVPGDSEGRDAIVAALFARGAQAVVEDGAALLTHFAAATDLADVRAAVHAADPGATISDAPLADEDWSVTWRSRLTAHEVGGLIVAPPWLAAKLDPERSVVIEPAMAFGTGDHATTRGVIGCLSRVLKHSGRGCRSRIRGAPCWQSRRQSLARVGIRDRERSGRHWQRERQCSGERRRAARTHSEGDAFPSCRSSRPSTCVGEHHLICADAACCYQ